MEAVEGVLVGAKVIAVVEGRQQQLKHLRKYKIIYTTHINVSNNLHVVNVTCTRLNIQYRCINSITYAIIINYNYIVIM